MQIDFPNNPVLNEVFAAENGVNYIWDGVKWTLKIEASDLLNLWARSPVQEELYPRNFDDTILFTALAINKLADLPAVP